jgi:hypothetical protein
MSADAKTVRAVADALWYSAGSLGSITEQFVREEISSRCSETNHCTDERVPIFEYLRYS